MPEEPSFAPLIGLAFLPGAVVVRLHGDLGRHPPTDVESLGQGLAAATDPVVINVAGVTSIDPAGLRWLMHLTGAARRAGRALILESPTPPVEAVLTLTGCHTWFSATTRPGPAGRIDTSRLIGAGSLPAGEPRADRSVRH